MVWFAGCGTWKWTCSQNGLLTFVNIRQVTLRLMCLVLTVSVIAIFSVLLSNMLGSNARAGLNEYIDP